MNDKKAYKYRMDGMAYALKIADGQGIDALRNEVRARGATFIPLEVTADATRELSAFLADRIINTYTTTMLFTLNDRFGFGEKRLKDFFMAFGHNCEMVSDLDPFGNNYEKISEYAKILKDKYGIDLNYEKILQVEHENKSNRKRMADLDYVIAFLDEHGFSEAAKLLESYSES